MLSMLSNRWQTVSVRYLNTYTLSDLKRDYALSWHKCIKIISNRWQLSKFYLHTVFIMKQVYVFSWQNSQKLRPLLDLSSWISPDHSWRYFRPLFIFSFLFFYFRFNKAIAVKFYRFIVLNNYFKFYLK